MFQQWQRYSVYKDSGIEWLGEIPAHWGIKRVKYLGAVNTSNVDKKSNLNEKKVSLCNYVDVYYNDYITSDLNFQVASATKEQIVKFTLQKGDVLLTKDSETWDDIAVPACVAENLENVVCGYHLAHIRPNLTESYGRYVFRSIQAQGLKEKFWVEANGVTRFGLSKYAIANALLLNPPRIEQKAIARFLDRETAKIDTSIQKKKRLIELLREKRTAIINQAVTKGLNPDVPMKDSGIEWLGEIPEHWKILPARRLIKNIEQGWSPTAIDRIANKDEWGVIKLNAVNKGIFNPQQNKALPNNITPDIRYEIKKDDVLLTRANTPNLVGDNCVVSETRPGLMLCDLVYRININDKVLERKYFSYWFLSPVGRYQITRDARGSSLSMVKVSQNHILSWIVLLPPLKEQQEIKEYLDLQTTKIDTLMAKTRTSIEKLQEYRTALISAAVTGKIDVRNNQ